MKPRRLGPATAVGGLGVAGVVGGVGMAAVLALAAGPAAAGWAAPRLVLGPSDNIALDQPRVAVELFTDADASQSLGPSFFNTFLLDTGSTSTLAVGNAVVDLEAAGYQTEGTYEVQGVGGTTDFDVSAPYRVDFAGTDGIRQTILDQRILSNPDGNFGSFNGIIGMTGMAGRVIELDMTGWSGGIDFDNLYMKVFFHDAVPAATGPRYTVTMDMVHFEPEGELPLPDAAPLPFVELHGARAGRRTGGQFVMDTGGQMSMMSTAMAASLGIDLDTDVIRTVEILGADGSIVVPIVALDRLMLPMDEGFEMAWTDIQIGVLDIHPALDGIFGADLMTSGWFGALFSGGPDGYFPRIHFDFTDISDDTATMLLDLKPALDHIMLPGDLTGDGLVTGADLSILLANLGQSGGPMQGDLDLDGRIGLRDASVLLSNWGRQWPPPAGAEAVAIPEPATILLLGAAAPLLLRRRRPR